MSTFYNKQSLYFQILKIGRIFIGYDKEMQLEYLEYNERTTKTTTGADL